MHNSSHTRYARNKYGSRRRRYGHLPRYDYFSRIMNTILRTPGYGEVNALAECVSCGEGNLRDCQACYEYVTNGING